MSARIKTFVDLLADIKAELRVPSTDSSEDATILSLWQLCAVEVFHEKKGFFDCTLELTAAVVGGSNNTKAQLDGVVIDTIVSVQATTSIGLVDIYPFEGVVGPSFSGAPACYTVSAEDSVVPGESKKTILTVRPAESLSGSLKVVAKGIKIPASLVDTTYLQYESLYPEIIRRVLQRLQIKRSEVESAKLMEAK